MNIEKFFDKMNIITTGKENIQNKFIDVVSRLNKQTMFKNRGVKMEMHIYFMSSPYLFQVVFSYDYELKCKMQHQYKNAKYVNV